MRVYGRQLQPVGSPKKYLWVEIDTDAGGYDDAVNVTWLIQCLKLQMGESPFFADWGIPARQSVIGQIAPDFYVARMQQRFAPLFASLRITRVTPEPSVSPSTPTYRVNVLTHQGAVVNAEVRSFVLGDSTLGGPDVLG